MAPARVPTAVPRQADRAVAAEIAPVEPAAGIERTAARARAEGAATLESVASLYSEARSDLALDGGDSAGGNRELQAAARIGIASGRLPDDSNRDVLSGRQPGCGGDDGNRAARAAVWATAG